MLFPELSHWAAEPASGTAEPLSGLQKQLSHRDGFRKQLNQLQKQRGHRAAEWNSWAAKLFSDTAEPLSRLENIWAVKLATEYCVTKSSCCCWALAYTYSAAIVSYKVIKSGDDGMLEYQDVAPVSTPITCCSDRLQWLFFFLKAETLLWRFLIDPLIFCYPDWLIDWLDWLQKNEKNENWDLTANYYC